MNRSKILKFALVGLINNLTNLFIVFLSYEILNINAFFSGVLGFTFGGFLSFLLNSRYTFEYKNKSAITILKFFFLSLLILLIFSTIISILESFLNSIIISWIISTGIVFILNYSLQSRFVFKK